jgi:hypothetical protein
MYYINVYISKKGKASISTYSITSIHIQHTPTLIHSTCVYYFKKRSLYYMHTAHYYETKLYIHIDFFFFFFLLS